GFLLETHRESAAGLVKRLALYRLRAKAAIADVSSAYAVLVGWGAPVALAGVIAYPDPRLPELGVRVLARQARAGDAADRGGIGTGRDWHSHRIALGVPEAGKDYPLGDTFPHEADFDLLNGVSFRKGCFVGQEVVARMHNRATVRKRVVPIAG